MRTDVASLWCRLFSDIGLTDLASRLSDCDRSQIDPAVSASVPQGVMDKDQRREIGARYTDVVAYVGLRFGTVVFGHIAYQRFQLP